MIIMSKIILVTGGARSGKSSYAESLAKKFSEEVLYIATAVPFDDEMKDRIAKHRESRPTNWYTYEGYRNLKQIFQKDIASCDVILLDCITVMVTNLMFDLIGENVEMLTSEDLLRIEKEVMKEVSDFVDSTYETSKTVIFVTNELGSGLVPEYKLGRIFRDIAGRVNQYLAGRANEVFMTVCGIPMKIK
jgi:adenosylcobinamide kinase / adenosylcobinamide-phosphate guanylyltransferase